MIFQGTVNNPAKSKVAGSKPEQKPQPEVARATRSSCSARASQQTVPPTFKASAGRTAAGPMKQNMAQASTKHVTRTRGSSLASNKSFAPNDFEFVAPGSVQPFVFKPLTPRSAASFLHPGTADSCNADWISPPSSRRYISNMLNISIF